MAPGSLNPGSGRLPAPTCPPRGLSTCSPPPPRAGCAPPFPTRSPLQRSSEPPCPRICPALSPPGPHREAGKPRHRAARPRARGHTGSSQTAPLPEAAGAGAGPWGLGVLGFRPEVSTWARAATWWRPEVGLPVFLRHRSPHPMETTARWGTPGSLRVRGYRAGPDSPAPGARAPMGGMERLQW